MPSERRNCDKKLIPGRREHPTKRKVGASRGIPFVATRDDKAVDRETVERKTNQPE